MVVHPLIVTCRARRKAPRSRSQRPGSFVSDAIDLYFAENQTAVSAAEAEVVLQRDIDLHVTCGIGAEIQIAFGILIEDIDRWRRNLMVNGQHGEHRFQAAGSAEQMTRHRFSGVDH